jgi:hypothetical protein
LFILTLKLLLQLILLQLLINFVIYKKNLNNFSCQETVLEGNIILIIIMIVNSSDPPSGPRNIFIISESNSDQTRSQGLIRIIEVEEKLAVMISSEIILCYSSNFSSHCLENRKSYYVVFFSNSAKK